MRTSNERQESREDYLLLMCICRSMIDQALSDGAGLTREAVTFKPRGTRAMCRPLCTDRRTLQECALEWLFSDSETVVDDSLGFETAGIPFRVACQVIDKCPLATRLEVVDLQLEKEDAENIGSGIAFVKMQRVVRLAKTGDYTLNQLVQRFGSEPVGLRYELHKRNIKLKPEADLGMLNRYVVEKSMKKNLPRACRTYEGQLRYPKSGIPEGKAK